MLPSPPGYNLATADLRNFNVSTEDASRTLVQASQAASALPQGTAYPDPVLTGLVAALVKNTQRRNAQMGSFSWSLAAWFKTMVLNSNPDRSYLLIQNVGSGDVMVLFETGPTPPADFSAAAGQTALTVAQTRAVRIVGGGYFEPLVAPKNEVTIFTIGTATNGIVVEGV